MIFAQNGTANTSERECTLAEQVKISSFPLVGDLHPDYATTPRISFADTKTVYLRSATQRGGKLNGTRQAQDRSYERRRQRHVVHVSQFEDFIR